MVESLGSFWAWDSVSFCVAWSKASVWGFGLWVLEVCRLRVAA